MVKYECIFCNFLTSKKTDYNRHIQTKRHLEKVALETNSEALAAHEHLTSISQKNNTDIQLIFVKNQKSELISEIKDNKNIHQCIHCGNYFSRASSLTNHKKICPEIELNEIEKLKKENALLMQQNNTFHELIKNLTTPQTVNNITFVVNNYPDAPALEKLPTYTHLLEAKKMTLIDVVIMYYNDKKLDKFVGDFIIKSYKKNNAKDQSIWSSDIARLTYIIRESCKNTGADIWSYDKGGVKVKEFIIDPALSYIKNELIKYSDAHSLTTDEQTLNTLITITEIIMIINNNTLSDNIIKYIAPNFSLKTNNKSNIKFLEDAQIIN
ncbi:hypothetical protein Indivirus_9_7 [Indivirus ILV1]|uniref:C2H2-type domain-containing protein n=1 Tax=Indivirus ILV1 TaxID=1977633 RepID=A0A1V0SE77_9VIRU|nr:hypothetical protein Indivirus_9_7 [Indivirus ILV1]